MIDPNRQTPVDGYEISYRLREAVHLRTPVDWFPYAPTPADIDHTTPYQPPDTGGSHWQGHQIDNGIYIWRSPHGHNYLVDHTGTRPALTA